MIKFKNYTIESDMSGWTLSITKPRNENHHSAKPNTSGDRVIRKYYSTLEQTLNSIVELETISDDVLDIKEVLQIIKDTQRDIATLITRMRIPLRVHDDSVTLVPEKTRKMKTSGLQRRVHGD